MAMACCHLKLVMMLLPLWPAVPALAQSSAVPELARSSAGTPELLITDHGSVVRSQAPPSSSKLVDRVPQGPMSSPPNNVQMTFAPSVPDPNDRTPSREPPCPPTTALSPSDAEALVKRVAEQERFYPDFVLAVAKQESRFKVDALSSKGAYGLMQLMPATAKKFDVDRCNPEANVQGGIRFLRELHQRYRNPLYVLAAYNAGETALREHGGIPPFPETVDYVAAVLNDFYGYHGIYTAVGSASSRKVEPTRAGTDAAALPRRSTRQTSSAMSPTKAKPGDWLVQHVE
jgi:Transglycosylase SLT domain